MSIGETAGRVSKFTYARQLAAALAYLMVKQQDAAGLLSFADGPCGSVPASSRRLQLGRILKELALLTPERGTDVGRGLAGLAERLRRRGLVVFVSDCLSEPREIADALRLFRAHGHEVIVFQVLSPEERDFPFRDLVEFVDAETGERLLTQTADVADAYRDAFAAHVGSIRRACEEMNVDFVELGTDTRLDRALVDYLAKRRRSR
jgi:uncharacterized protein (DUF58 family)